ncbi:hypothetical protein L1O59_005489 [Salmonella enterica]|nr:hypothetical protein [Salmonella enterica]EAS0616009.1 hypothetical protein [Salmonella enterica subsp. enterica serovar Dahomey]ECD6162206.1 hypothetical protein [Salmonella enterica subsp. enterica]EHI8599645.1 hypothetical protein [Salmonella enterica subsp. enterica serovar 51:z:1,5]EAW3045965.1 hypothetical protein [Salmonella enterica]
MSTPVCRTSTRTKLILVEVAHFLGSLLPYGEIESRTIGVRAGVRICQFHRSGAPGKRQPEVVARIVPRVWCQQEVVSIFNVPVRGNSEPTFKLARLSPTPIVNENRLRFRKINASSSAANLFVSQLLTT